MRSSREFVSEDDARYAIEFVSRMCRDVDLPCQDPFRSGSEPRSSLAAFIAMKGTLDLKVTRVLEAGGLALVAGVWSFTGTGSDGKPVTLTGRNGDVLRRQADGSWRFVIDNPWGTD